MKPFDYNKYLKNNPLLKESNAFEAKASKDDGDETWFSNADYFRDEHKGYKLKPTDKVSIGDGPIMTYADAVKKYASGKIKEGDMEESPMEKPFGGAPDRSTYMKDKMNLGRYLPLDPDDEQANWTVDMSESMDIKADANYIKSVLAKKGIKVFKFKISKSYSDDNELVPALEITIDASQSVQFVAAIESSGFEVM